MFFGFKLSKNRNDIGSTEYNGGALSVLWLSDNRKRKNSISFTCIATNKQGQESRGTQVLLKSGE